MQEVNFLLPVMWQSIINLRSYQKNTAKDC